VVRDLERVTGVIFRAGLRCSRLGCGVVTAARPRALLRSRKTLSEIQCKQGDGVGGWIQL
jgi:hypothetical protein